MTLLVWEQNQDSAITHERLERLLEPLGGMDSIVRPGDRVLIKPNFVAPFFHAVTDLCLLSLIIGMIKDCGGKPILGESSGFEFGTESTFKILGIHEFALRHQIPLINFDHAEFETVVLSGGSGPRVNIPRVVGEVDRLINVPKLKRHSLTKATIGVKNLFGLLARESRRKVHSWGLEKAIYALGESIPSDLVIVDGSVVTARAVYGERQSLNLLVASKSVHATDIFCCQYLGLNYQDVQHLRRAVEKDNQRAQFKVLDVSKKSSPAAAIPYTPVQDYNGHRDPPSKKIHRWGYQLMYFLDILYNRFRRDGSLIPTIHYYLGIRPFIKKSICDDCGQCVEVCPVSAIQLPERRICAKRCMPVRCLKCIPACPKNAIVVRGRDVDPTLAQI